VSAEAPQESAEAAPDGGEGGTGGACPAVPQEGFDLFVGDVVAAGPADGAVFGDGSTLSFTFTEPVEGTPDLDLFYVNEAGDAIQMGGLFLEDQGDNTWTTSNLVFTSDAEGRPGFAFLGITTNVGLDDEGIITGDHEVVGIYCLSLKVAP
jgi:hypothetical protein